MKQNTPRYTSTFWNLWFHSLLQGTALNYQLWVHLFHPHIAIYVLKQQQISFFFQWSSILKCTMQFFVKKDTKKYILKYRSRCSKGIEIWTMKKKKDISCLFLVKDWEEKKKYCQKMCKLKKEKKRMLKITFKEESAFLSEVNRQRHVNNSAYVRSHGHD